MTTLNTLPIQLDKLDYLQGPQILEREAALWAEILTPKGDETARQARRGRSKHDRQPSAVVCIFLVMPFPSEYDTWLCHECPEGKTCLPVWQVCKECDNQSTEAGTHCDACSGSGGCHVCAHEDWHNESALAQPECNQTPTP